MVLAATQAYYGAVAGLIPVLLLVLAVGDGRLRARNPITPFSSFLFSAFACFVIMILGELSALRALRDGHDTEALELTSAAGIAFGLTLVAVQFIGAIIDDFNPTRDQRRRRLRLAMIGSVGIAIGSLLFLLPHPFSTSP